MKKVYYENGPDEIRVGPANNQVLMKRGESLPFDDKIADSLLAKPMFKEAIEDPPQRSQRSQRKSE